MNIAPLRNSLSRYAGSFLTLLLLAGCRDQQRSSSADANDSSLRPLSMLYARYQNANRGRPPASEEQFRAFIEEHGQKVLELTGVDSVDAVFTSQRDGQPYVVLYGSDAAKHRNSGLVAYERQGVDGQRYIGYRLGFVEQVDEARFRELVPGAPP